MGMDVSIVLTLVPPNVSTNGNNRVGLHSKARVYSKSHWQQEKKPPGWSKDWWLKFSISSSIQCWVFYSCCYTVYCSHVRNLQNLIYLDFHWRLATMCSMSPARDGEQELTCSAHSLYPIWQVGLWQMPWATGMQKGQWTAFCMYVGFRNLEMAGF